MITGDHPARILHASSTMPCLIRWLKAAQLLACGDFYAMELTCLAVCKMSGISNKVLVMGSGNSQSRKVLESFQPKFNGLLKKWPQGCTLVLLPHEIYLQKP
jgi:hypothetical protein